MIVEKEILKVYIGNSNDRTVVPFYLAIVSKYYNFNFIPIAF